MAHFISENEKVHPRQNLHVKQCVLVALSSNQSISLGGILVPTDIPTAIIPAFLRMLSSRRSAWVG
jgi:hypothetical protein